MAFKKARQSNSIKDWTRYKNIQKSCKDQCRKANNEYVCDMVSDESNCKKLYSFVKDKNYDNAGVAPLKKGWYHPCTKYQDRAFKSTVSFCIYNRGHQFHP